MCALWSDAGAVGQLVVESNPRGFRWVQPDRRTNEEWCCPPSVLVLRQLQQGAIVGAQAHDIEPVSEGILDPIEGVGDIERRGGLAPETLHRNRWNRPK